MCCLLSGKLDEVLIVEDDLETSVQCLSVVEESRTLVRELKLVRGEEERRIWHLLFTAWPYNVVPDSEDQSAVMDLIKMSRFRIFREANGVEMMESGPRIVHCSAGVGKTGTFIALDYLLQEMEKWQMDDMGH
jgi:protein-tyrosine phosphatase